MVTVIPPTFALPLGPDLALLPRLPIFAAAYHELLASNQERLRRWDPSSGRQPVIDEVRAKLETTARAWLEGGTLPTLLAVPAEGGWQLVGTAGVGVDRTERVGEVGFWVDTAFEGRSYAARAVRALLEQSFTQLGLERVFLRTDVDNERCRRLAVRLGFREANTTPKTLLIDGLWRDEVRYELMLSEWQEPGPRQARESS